MQKLRTHIILLVAIILGLSLFTQPRAASAEELRLGIIHTNDLHGCITPFEVEGVGLVGGFARCAASIQNARLDGSFSWLVLDAGDASEGTPYSELTRGISVFKCMNAMGYDAMCLGNCEFDYGFPHVLEYAKEADFPLLCANLSYPSIGKRQIPPYAIFERVGYRIGVIGLLRETTAQNMYHRLGGQIRTYPVIPAAADLAHYLRGIGCDIVIALTHQGYDHDLELAKAVPELDLIIGGHSHTTLTEPTRVGDVIVTTNGAYGQTLGVLKLSFKRDDSAGRFTLEDFSEVFQPLGPDQPSDEDVAAIAGEYRRIIDEQLGEVICTSAQDFPVDRVRYEENALADMVADALLKTTGVDCVLFTGGHFQAGIKAGPVTFSDLYYALPHNNVLMKVTASGAKLREMLDWGGTQYGAGFPHIAGMRVRYVDTKLAEATVSGKPIDDHAQYTVLMNDFLACNTAGFPIREDPFGPASTGLRQRDLFVEWARKQKVLAKETDGRTVFEWINKEPPTKGK